MRDGILGSKLIGSLLFVLFRVRFLQWFAEYKLLKLSVYVFSEWKPVFDELSGRYFQLLIGQELHIMRITMRNLQRWD